MSARYYRLHGRPGSPAIKKLAGGFFGMLVSLHAPTTICVQLIPINSRWKVGTSWAAARAYSWQRDGACRSSTRSSRT